MRVLIAEDDFISRNILENMSEKPSLKLVLAGDVQSAGEKPKYRMHRVRWFLIETCRIAKPTIFAIKCDSKTSHRPWEISKFEPVRNLLIGNPRIQKRITYLERITS